MRWGSSALVLQCRRVPMFRARTNVIATLVLGAGVACLGYRFAVWAAVKAVWTLPPGADSSLCRAATAGACWAVVGERFRFILFGVYPFGEQWRPLAACLLFVALYGASAMRDWWRPWLLAVWILVPLAATLLLHGGFLGVAEVPSELWGGLPLTLLLSTVGFGAAFPLAVLLALGRRSKMPAIRGLAIGYIEVIRGVPIITFLFMASVMFPLFVPQGITVDKLLRAQIALVMVIAAYLAEVIRAGFAAIPQGQFDAAASLGLPFAPATILIVLPQALRATLPALVNTFLAFFKDTSLVAVIGLFDLLGAGRAVIVDPKWVGFSIEVYLFVAAIYFAFGYAVSRYSRYLEQTLTASAQSGAWQAR